MKEDGGHGGVTKLGSFLESYESTYLLVLVFLLHFIIAIMLHCPGSYIYLPILEDPPDHEHRMSCNGISLSSFNQRSTPPLGISQCHNCVYMCH